jgi:hypothetical protein
MPRSRRWPVASLLRTGRRLARAAGLVGLVAITPPLAAQASGVDHDHDEPRRVPTLPQREFRAEAVAATDPSAVAAFGLNLRAGWYARVGASLGAGAQWREAGPTVGVVRADATVRFLLDPFAERRRGLYGGVGISALHAGGGIGGQPPVLLLLAGVESRPRGGRVWAVEAGLGGGVRIALVRRRARADGYR